MLALWAQPAVPPPSMPSRRTRKKPPHRKRRTLIAWSERWSETSLAPLYCRSDLVWRPQQQPSRLASGMLHPSSTSAARSKSAPALLISMIRVPLGGWLSSCLPHGADRLAGSFSFAGWIGAWSTIAGRLNRTSWMRGRYAPLTLRVSAGAARVRCGVLNAQTLRVHPHSISRSELGAREPTLDCTSSASAPVTRLRSLTTLECAWALKQQAPIRSPPSLQWSSKWQRILPPCSPPQPLPLWGRSLLWHRAIVGSACLRAQPSEPANSSPSMMVLVCRGACTRAGGMSYRYQERLR
mmetsp:Transcript_52735/g.145802  ORF Transcript_52735/g.145802 Transcript_52735/m.145802 type:complete len:296 (+) Transcript_52735:971-1858(+)